MQEQPKVKTSTIELDAEEQKRYDAIMRIFPATHPDSAVDYAINPPNFQFIPT